MTDAKRITAVLKRYKGVGLSISDIADEAGCSYPNTYRTVRKLHFYRRLESARAEHGRVYWQGERLI